MQGTAFSSLALFAIFMAILLLSAQRLDAADGEAPAQAKNTSETGVGKVAKVDSETTAPPAEGNVSRIESISRESPAPTPEPENAALEQTIYPGVQNIHIQSGSYDSPRVSFNYPAFRVDAVDESLRVWAESITRSFEKEMRETFSPGGEKTDEYIACEMTGLYSLERPSPKVVSIVFNIYSYTGGAHGNLAIICRNYDLASGKRLDFASLFKNPEKALEIMSAYSREALPKILGEESDDEMILYGTTPEMENFSELVLTPQGISIQFQPYQVGPWSAGPQQLEMSLAQLAQAGPEQTVWPQAGNTDAKADAEPAPEPAVNPAANSPKDGETTGKAQ